MIMNTNVAKIYVQKIKIDRKVESISKTTEQKKSEDVIKNFIDKYV